MLNCIEWHQFGVNRSNGFRARGHKAEKRNRALRAQFWPDRVVTYMAHIPHQGAPSLKVWALGLFPFGLYPGQSVFAKGSRGGTWHVPRSTWRHVTNAIVVPALWRIFWCLLRPDRTVRSGAIHESPWTDWHTYWQTGPAELQKSTLPRGNLHSSEWTTSILLHYDFELEAICFEPLVSRSLVSFFDTFRLVMFIEAGDVTHRRRGSKS